MQRFQILKHNFTGLTLNETIHYSVADSVDNVPILEIPGTKLQFINNYYSYSSELGINIVNDTNVRDYLDDEKNLSLSMQFIDHLHNSTQIEEFKEIFYNNKKLSAVFNEFYKNNILSNQSTTIAIHNSLRLAKSLPVSSSAGFDEFNNRNFIHAIVLNENTKDDSYYIPLYIERSQRLIDQGDYSDYFKDCFNGIYNYKKYLWINDIKKDSIFGNAAYINNRKGPIFGIIGISEFTPFNNLTPTFEVALVTGGRGIGTNSNPFDYFFNSFSEFKKYFNYTSPEFVSQSPGLYITQDSIFITHSSTYSYNSGYGNYGDENIKLKFITNSAIKWDKSNGNISVPITIQIDKPFNNDSSYIIKAENFSTATLFTDFIINNTLPTSNQHIATIAAGDTEYSFNMILKEPFTVEESAILSLHNSSGETYGFLIIKLEETIEISKYTDKSYLLIEDENRIKIMLRCFVDLDYNDNESNPWRNNNIHVIDNSFKPDGDLFDTTHGRFRNPNLETIQSLARLVGTPVLNVINIYKFGSIIFGTQNSNSDLDYIMVLERYKTKYENFKNGNINIQIYTKSEYLNAINMNTFPLLETTFYPSEFIIKEDLDVRAQLIVQRLKDAAISNANVDYNRAKRNTIVGEKSNYFVKKNLFHAFRKLVFALELIKNNKISDFTIAMPYYNFIFSQEFSTANDLDTLFKEKFETLVSQVRNAK